MMTKDSDETPPQGALHDIPANGNMAADRDGETLQQQFRKNVPGGETGFRAIHLEGARDHYHHKGIWSWFLMTAIGAMILLQFALLFPVGLGQLDFTPYDWLLPALLVQTFGQVTGLAVYAVRYLFSDISNQPSERSNRNPGDSG